MLASDLALCKQDDGSMRARSIVDEFVEGVSCLSGRNYSRIGQLHHGHSSVLTDDPAGVALPTRVFQKHKVTRRKATDFTIARLIVHFARQVDDELPSRSRMPVPEPTSRTLGQTELPRSCYTRPFPD